MTKDKLLKLYNKFKDEEIDISVIRKLRNCTNKDIDIILNSFYPEIMIDIIICYEFKLLNSKDQEEIIELVNNAKTEKIAYEISRIISSGIILSSGLTTKIAKIINESTIVSAPYIAALSLTNSVLINPKSLEIMKIIGSSNKEYQAKIALDILKNIEVILNENVLEIIKIVSEIEKESHSELYVSIAKNREVLAANLTVKLMILASKLDDEQIKILNIIASDKLLEKNKRSVYYILKMLEEKHKIPSIFEQVKKEISFFKLKESKIKKDNDLFWNIYKNNPNEAIELIKENDDQVVTTLTKVKNKI